MTAESPTANSNPQAGFDVVFKEVRQNTELVEQVEAVTREMENIRQLSQAISDVNTPRVMTFVTT